MGYSTYFSDGLEIRPALPPEWVEGFENDRNQGNFLEDYGIEGSGHWDDCIDFTFRQHRDGYTFIDHDGSEKTYEYLHQIQSLVDLVRAQFPDRSFSGFMAWSGEEDDDIGVIRVNPVTSRVEWQTVEIKPDETREWNAIA